MAEDPISIRPEWAADFERMGTSALAAALPRYQGEVRAAAMAWLGQKERERASVDQERFARAEASISEQMALTRESNAIASDVKTRARHDRTVALATLIMTTIGTAAAIIGLFIH